jgi:drug/metabolite transporter (DMT)-like permease
MLWALLSLTGACTNAVYFIANKEFLKRLDANVLASCGFLATSVFLLVLALATGIPPAGPGFVTAAIATTILNIIATTLTFRALATTDISLAIPMLSFTPLFLVGTAFLLLGELPSVAGVLGILVIVAGSYFLNTAAEHTRITDPFRAMLTDRGVLAMLVVAFIYSLAINFDKMVVLETNAIFGPGIVFLLLGLSFGIIALVARRGILPAALRPPIPPLAGSGCPGGMRYLAGAGLLTGLLITVEAVSINTAYLVQIVPYVIAIKRMSIMLVVLYGTIVFGEKEILRRLAGAGLMVLGAILILAFP